MSTFLNRAVTGVTFVAICAVGSSSVSAQDAETIPLPVAEVSGGYTFMRDFSDDLPAKTNFPAGWYAAAAVNLNQWFGVVGEATGSYRNTLDFSLGPSSFSHDASVYTVMGGPRFGRKGGRLHGYGQVLAGAARIRSTTSFPEQIAGIGSVTRTETEFAIQPGAGVTIFLTERFGVRVAGDYRCLIDFAEDETEYSNEMRVLAGFVLHWGAR